ncbi:MAG: hypothetical protein KTR15_08355 [Phycisphaeraceae bacterium]|nr:hypothetical protein [Phycisphaeraceae bacterium]
MPLNPHTWLPTTKKQSVLVYALNVLLLLNLTVIVVMLTGTAEPAREQASAPQREAGDDLDRPTVLLPQSGSPDQPVVSSPAPEPVPLTQVSAEPFVLAGTPTEPEQTEPTQGKPVQPEPAQDDPPVTFFGVGLD